MGKVIYLTTAQGQKEFERLLPKWRVSPNLSNQNFHNKLVRAVSLVREVDAVSARPINIHFFIPLLHKKTVKEDNVTWKYIQVNIGKVNKKLLFEKRIRDAIGKPSEDDVLMVDTLNYSLLKAAVKFARANNLKIIGIVTDNPLNISYTSAKYKNKVLELGQSLDAFVCLTDKLNNLYNPENKPFVIIDGVTEQTPKLEPKHKIDTPYIFFGGSLMHEYGVRHLINAFVALERDDIKLVICGHHEDKNFKSYVKHFKNIVYLGALPYSEVNALEKGALLAVNPRPINEKIDDYSFPSKTLEYLSNGVLTISVKNPLLVNRYKEAIIWAESGSMEDLKAAMEYALSLEEKEKEKIKKTAIKAVSDRTSFEAVSKVIETLF